MESIGYMEKQKEEGGGGGCKNGKEFCEGSRRKAVRLGTASVE